MTTNKPFLPTVAWIILVAMISVLCYIYGFSDGTGVMRKSAIDLGYAEYHPSTGKWQWRTVEQINAQHP